MISGLLVFLSIVGIARKIRSKRHGWADDHVPIVVKPGRLRPLVEDLRGALTSAGIPVDTEDAPWVLTMPARLLTSVAGSNVRKLRPDRLVNLVTPELRIGVYPSDIAISGPTRERTRARAAIISDFATTAAHLTTSAEAQEVEDQIAKLARSRDRGRRRGRPRAGGRPVPRDRREAPGARGPDRRVGHPLPAARAGRARPAGGYQPGDGDPWRRASRPVSGAPRVAVAGEQARAGEPAVARTEKAVAT